MAGFDKWKKMAPYADPQKPFVVDEYGDICDANGWLVFETATDVWPDRQSLADRICANLNDEMNTQS